MIRGLVKMSGICNVDPLVLKSHLEKLEGYPAHKEKGVWVFEEDFEGWWMDNYDPSPGPLEIRASELRRITGMARGTVTRSLAEGMPHRKDKQYVYMQPMEVAEWLISKGGRRRETGEILKKHFAGNA